MTKRVQVFTSHEEARQAQLLEWSKMSKEERLQVGAELHSFWVRNFYPNASRMDRSVQIVQRSAR